LLAAILYQGNPEKNNKLWNITHCNDTYIITVIAVMYRSPEDLFEIQDSKFIILINQWDENQMMLNRSETILTYLKGDHS